VFRGKFDKETGRIEAGEPLEGGLRNPVFSRIPEQGYFSRIFTSEGGKLEVITEIRVMIPKKKKD